MKKKISLMQGRLLPPVKGRFQAYPYENWQQEFYEAAKLGLYSIEWIYEKPYEIDNAFTTSAGIDLLQNIIKDTGVLVKSICADYYMSEYLIRDGNRVTENWEHLEWLCAQAKELDVCYIVLPFVDSSSLKTKESQDALSRSLKQFIINDKNKGIELHLETDLTPQEFQHIFQNISHPLVKMNYDIGNSASLGYDPNEEFSLLGSYLGSVHIKDRILNAHTVELGTGNADFKKCFSWFKNLNFNRWYVLQAARGIAGLESQNIESQITFVSSYGS